MVKTLSRGSKPAKPPMVPPSPLTALSVQTGKLPPSMTKPAKPKPRKGFSGFPKGK